MNTVGLPTATGKTKTASLAVGGRTPAPSTTVEEWLGDGIVTETIS